jgi:hypothetical protein
MARSAVLYSRCVRVGLHWDAELAVRIIGTIFILCRTVHERGLGGAARGKGVCHGDNEGIM